MRLKTEVSQLSEQPVFADLVNAQTSVTHYFDYSNYGHLYPTVDY
ncbi:MAG: hypothetical protein ACRYG7_15795 [Janthinobacterium lividum]